MVNALSIDLEDWYQVPLARIPLDQWGECRATVCESTYRILDFLSRCSTQATFFVSGYIADRHPDLIDDIFQAGHEIESHGYWHELAYRQRPEQFAEDILKSSVVLEEITGKKPIGYRSPAWSTTRIPDRAAQVLLENSFVYDSSLFPTSNFLYGRMNFRSDVCYFYRDTALLEIPPTTFRILGLKVPVTGGFYLRLTPLRIMKHLMRLKNKKEPVQIYFHPWEVTVDYPRMQMPVHHSFIQYYHCGSMLDRIEELMTEFQFGSLQQAYPQIQEAADKR